MLQNQQQREQAALGPWEGKAGEKVTHRGGNDTPRRECTTPRAVHHG